MLVAKPRERETRGAEDLKGARPGGGLTNCPKARGKPQATTVQSLTSSTQTNTYEDNVFALANREDTAISRIYPSTSVLNATCLKHTESTKDRYTTIHNAFTEREVGTPWSTVHVKPRASHTCTVQARADRRVTVVVCHQVHVQNLGDPLLHRTPRTRTNLRRFQQPMFSVSDQKAGL